MGYYTSYQLTIEQKKNNSKDQEIQEILNSNVSDEVKKKVVSIIEEKAQSFAVTEQNVIDFVGFNPFKQECKWYHHDDDMIDISKKYPDTLFILNGDGEESGDLWRKYYYNGKMQNANATITYEFFDETKLI